MNSYPLVSILMTAYNREKYIAEAIESILHANYENWELIIVDDVSSDKSLEIARSYEAKDSRIKVYQNPKNLGDYPNRNKAASYAKGKYIKYVDSDDYIYPDWFAVMVSAMEQFPEAGLGLNRFKRNSKNSGPFYYNSEEAWRLHFFSRPVFGASPLSAIMRKDVFDRVGGFSEIRYSGDLDMWLKMTAISGLIVAEHPLAEWRSHGDQEKIKGKEHYLKTGRTIEKNHLMSEYCPLDDKIKYKALELINISHSLKVMKHVLHLDIPTTLKVKKSYGIGWQQIIYTIWLRVVLGKNFYIKLQCKYV
ncbi:MAG: glycosyltransferase family 2 protein [Cyclobacteriaceae bacterium]|nr:glycosyltransferase family 2 protein [Cyclobacteriaceae bacterium]